ncbi:THAP domain-containing protein 1-like [Uloborus diversus]|uniref:THAP domain-containing protein 1-like n=1 Tax=Uloborus diversus TaxID=327109 RepID=UPI002409396F|nr:THAP domain-containing protein 1-like [Uloborus diversus]
MPSCVAYGCTNRPGKKIPGISFHRFPKKLSVREAWIAACRWENWQPSSVSLLCSMHFTEDQIDRSNPVLPRLKRNAVPNVFPAFPSYLHKKLKKRKSPMKRNNLLQINRFEQGVSSSMLCDKVPLVIDVEEVVPNAVEAVENTFTNKTDSPTLPIKKVDVVFHQKEIIKGLNHELEVVPGAVEAIENTFTSKIGLPTLSIKEVDVVFHQKEIIKGLKHRLEESNSLIYKYRKKIKTLQQQTRRQKIIINSMKDVLKAIQETHFMDEDSLESLSGTASPSLQLMKREVAKCSGKPTKNCSKELSSMSDEED